MRKLSVILIAALVIGLFPPSGLTNYVHADTLPPFEAEADLMYEDINGSSQSVTSDSLGSGTFYTGREVFAGDTYISRSAFRFKLPDTVDIPGTPTKYELKFHIIQKNPIDPLFYLDIWGSANNDMSDAVDDAPFTFPTWDTSTPTVRKTNNEIPTSGDITFDVTALVKHFTDATDRDITFVMKGNESVFSNIILNTREEPLTHPQLIVTYSPNYTPTGSISINNGDPYTNSTNVGLNLTGVDQDSDPIEMQFSNDNIAWSSYETYASTVSSWDLSNGDGVKTVYYRLKDDSDAVSTTYSDTIILDSIAPTIPNVDNGGLYNIDKTITFNEGTGSLNGKPFTTGSIVSTEGIHTLVVTDAAGNSTSVTFTIDKTAPAVTGVDNGASYNSDRTVTFDDGTATLNTAPFSSGTTITAEGVYSLVVTDAALNVTTVIFIIDKTNPVITGVDDGATYNTTKTISFNDGTGLLNGNPFLSGSTVNLDGTHTLVVTDAAGNSTSVTFTIDKTAPAVIGVDNGASYNSDRTVTFDDGTATLNTAPFTSGTTITAEDDYTLVVTDDASNVTTIAFTIDKTNPVITGVTDGDSYNSDPTITFDEGTGVLDGSPFTSGTSVSMAGSHTLVVTDAAGNSTSVSFSIDKTAPVVTGVVDGTSYNSNRTVAFDEGTATLNTDPFTSGMTIISEGDYTLVVTDDASNVTTIAFTIDKTNPVITGVTDGDSYNSDPTITFDEGTGMLDGSPFTSGTSVSGAGSHTLVVTDEAGNSTSLTFTIDKTAPVVTGVTDGTSYNSDLTVTFDEGSAMLNTAPFSSGTTVTAEGDYTLVVTDDASNVTTIAFTIDKTNPVITGVTDGDSYNNDPTITFDEGTGMLDGSPFTSGTSVSAAGPHTLVVTDAAGNSTSVTFTIDKTAPVVTGVTDGTSYNSDLTVTFDEGTAMLNTAPFSSGTTITAEGDYTLVVTDDASNVTTLAFTIDKTNPVITGVIDGDSYNSDLTITFDEGTGMLDGSPFTSGSSVSMAGSHTLIVTDAAGNSTSVTFSIDKTAPVVTGVNDGTSYNSDRTVTFDEGTATLNTAPFTSGTTITAEGDYILVVTDDASNVTTLAFTIDKTNPIITGVIDGESYTTSKLVTFNEGTAALNGSAFTSGTTIQTSGTYTLIVTDAAGNHTTAAFIIKLPIPDSGSSGGGIVITNPEEKVTLIINEKAIPSNQLIKATAQVINNKKTTTITFDQEKLKDILNKEQSKSSITVKADNSSSTVAAALNGALLEYLASKDAVIKLQTDSASYTLPIQRINIDNLVKQLSAKSGTTIALKDINVNIEMTTIPKDEVNMNQSQLGQISLVSPAVEFNLTATYGSHTIEINHFNDFVQRTITIPTSTDSQKITGVIITKEGKLSPVPTKVTKGEDGKQHGVINSLSNSVYALISYDKTFSDITNHWAKTSIEDMASRLIVQGNTEQQFLPNTQITRAEFTTIVVRALGLSAVDQPVEFTDVQPSDWFYDTVAAGVNSGLIKGYEDGSFKPEQNLTREEAMVIIFRALERSGMDISISETKVNEILQAFNDNDQFNAWSRTAAAINIQYNIINGVDGSALPDKNITRAETAAIVQRFLQQAKLI